MKATRVHETEYALIDCPVCGEAIVGTLTVEIHLGDVSVKQADDLRAEVAVQTRMRSLAIAHRCPANRSESAEDDLEREFAAYAEEYQDAEEEA